MLNKQNWKIIVIKIEYKKSIMTSQYSLQLTILIVRQQPIRKSTGIEILKNLYWSVAEK